MTEWRCQTIRALFPASVRKIEWCKSNFSIKIYVLFMRRFFF